MMNKEEEEHPRSHRLRQSISSSSTSSASRIDDDDDDSTEDDHAIATILAADEISQNSNTNNNNSNNRLGRRLSHLDSIPHTPRVITQIPDANDATFDHGRLSERLATYSLAELQIEGDGNCQFRALADQLFRNPDYHKYVRKKVIKQLKRYRRFYESYVPMRYKHYLRRMKKFGEWGDHVTLQAAADYFGAKICLVTSFRDTCYIEILPNGSGPPSREIWLSFWSEVHYNSLYDTGEVPTRAPKKKHWLF